MMTLCSDLLKQGLKALVGANAITCTRDFVHVILSGSDVRPAEDGEGT